jgi:hypothetical protein
MQRLLAPAEVFSLEERKVLLEDAEKAASYDAGRPVDIITQELKRARPAGGANRRSVARSSRRACGQIAVEKDLLEPLQTAVQNWPRAERDIFELYFIEGFEPDEIAMNLPDEILAALEFSGLDSKALCRIDELAYRTGGR